MTGCCSTSNGPGLKLRLGPGLGLRLVEWYDGGRLKEESDSLSTAVPPVGMEVTSVNRVDGMDMTEDRGEVAALSTTKLAAIFSSIVIKGSYAVSLYCCTLSWYVGGFMEWVLPLLWEFGRGRL